MGRFLGLNWGSLHANQVASHLMAVGATAPRKNGMPRRRGPKPQARTRRFCNDTSSRDGRASGSMTNRAMRLHDREGHPPLCFRGLDTKKAPTLAGWRVVGGLYDYLQLWSAPLAMFTP
jgi:hypothetical protein